MTIHSSWNHHYHIIYHKTWQQNLYDKGGCFGTVWMEKVERLVNKMKVCDMHCDTVMALRQQRQEGEKAELLKNSGHVDLLRMR